MVIKGIAEVEHEDGGMATIAYISSEDGVEVRLHDWQEDASPSILNDLEGKEIRVTVEVL